ncbi:hypothetical protein [Duganella sp. BuS-21]|uniref:hypothetical protein n=1 Tax=Duganella sp. BuS-21 TaxID=2943848 RepID=UPI0035A7084E
MKRLKEASTWAGLAAILQGLKAVLPQHAVVLDGLTVVAGLVAGVVPEKGAPAPAEGVK